MNTVLVTHNTQQSDAAAFQMEIYRRTLEEGKEVDFTAPGKPSAPLNARQYPLSRTCLLAAPPKDLGKTWELHQNEFQK